MILKPQILWNSWQLACCIFTVTQLFLSVTFKSSSFLFSLSDLAASKQLLSLSLSLSPLPSPPPFSSLSPWYSILFCGNGLFWIHTLFSCCFSGKLDGAQKIWEQLVGNGFVWGNNKRETARIPLLYVWRHTVQYIQLFQRSLKNTVNIRAAGHGFSKSDNVGNH